MTIPIETNISDYFKLYLTILNPLLKLKTREIEILSGLLLIHYANRKDPKINEKVLSTDVKKAIRLSIKMTEASFNNHLSALRKKKMITDQGINPLLTRDYSAEITYKLIVK